MWQHDAIWHALIGNEERGPMSRAQVMAYLRDGSLGENDFVWRPGFEDRVPLREVREFWSPPSRPERQPEAVPPPLAQVDVRRSGGSTVLSPKRRLAKKFREFRESFVAGATNTGNITATVDNKLVLNWHGTPTQRDDVLRMLPVIRDKMMPDVRLESFADATIASIFEDGMSPDHHMSNVQTIAMLWRIFTTPLDDGTYGDLIAHINMHATFELHEQTNDQFKITWKISVMRGRTP